MMMNFKYENEFQIWEYKTKYFMQGISTEDTCSMKGILPVSLYLFFFPSLLEEVDEIGAFVHNQ